MKYIKFITLLGIFAISIPYNTIYGQSKIIGDHKAVDLGLSVLWADCNVGASFPWQYGDYFAWGETEPKTIYNDTKGQYMGDISGSHLDAAAFIWGYPWRLPTEEEMKELIKECAWEWREMNGVEGCKVTGPSGNSIFLPAAGNWGTHSSGDIGREGNYWTSIPNNTDRWGAREDAYFLELKHAHPKIEWRYRNIFRSIRPVTDK